VRDPVPAGIARAVVDATDAVDVASEGTVPKPPTISHNTCMDGKLKIGLGVLAVLAALYVFPFFVPLPERTTEAIIPPFPAEYGAAAIADLEAAETLYREGDLRAAYDLWKPLADAGNPEAQFRIGRLYDLGELFEEDWAVAQSWYLNSTAQDHALSFSYIAARELMRDSETCNPIYTKNIESAAELGYLIAQFNLGVLNLKGRCFEKNYLKAERYFKLAASQGHHESHIALVNIYARAKYLRKSPQDAYFHMLIVSQSRTTMFPVVFYLALISSTPKDRRAAAKRLETWQPRLLVRHPLI
jgi:TPR repeat protein